MSDIISRCKTIALACFCIPSSDQEADSFDYTTIDESPKTRGNHILTFSGPDMAIHKEFYDSSDEVKQRVDVLKANRWFSTYRINYA